MGVKGPPRKFDYDEARRLRDGGMSYAAIGRLLGVSDTAVFRALNPRVRARMDAAVAKWIRDNLRVPCRGGCRRLVWMRRTSATGYCQVCLAEKRREQNVRHGTENEYRYGCRCEPCRLGASAAKRARREKTRVPCATCGTLVDGINRRTPDKPPECHPCSLRRIHAERKRRAAA